MGRTFITEGNMSLCIRYVKRLVWYAPDVMARATLTALCRISTMCPRQHLYVPAGPSASGRGTGPHSLLLPLRIMESNELTKSVKTASIWSRPASTVMISELGFVYFLERTAERKMLRVCSCKRHQHTLHKYAIWVRRGPTSSAFKETAPPEPFSVFMDLANSCLVCSSISSRSVSVSSSRMRRSDARSGLRRKNSRQKPSDSLSFSASSSSSLVSQSVGFDRGSRAWASSGYCQTYNHMPRTHQLGNLWGKGQACGNGLAGRKP